MSKVQGGCVCHENDEHFFTVFSLAHSFRTPLPYPTTSQPVRPASPSSYDPNKHMLGAAAVSCVPYGCGTEVVTGNKVLVRFNFPRVMYVTNAMTD